MNKPLRALIVEDSEDDALLIVRELKRGGYAPIFERVETAEAMTDMLTQQAWDIVISDYSMPHFSVPEALKLLQETGLDLPFIIVSGSIGEETAVAVMKAGAHDYMMKDNLARLAPAVERELRDAETRRRHRQAEHDIGERVKELTCLYEVGQLVAQTGTSLDELLKGTVELIPPAWQCPEITCARITFGDKEFRTDNFKTSEWEQSADINVKARKEGTVEVYYLEEKPEAAEGPFLKEERDLINGIARMLGDMLERRQLETQLFQSQKMEAIGTLAGGVAHDFNNLLTAILGYSQLALADIGDNDTLVRDIEEIKNAGERATSLTRQLLTFSRQEVLQPEILDLNALVANIEKMLQRLISEDIELAIILKPKLKSIKADPGQIEQVIMNLVVNAKDAMPEGGKIIIRTESIIIEEEYCKFYPDAKTGEFVSLLVEDTGAGIDKEVMQHIFEPFFTTKEPSKGTGLGLSVVYGIVRQHGGWINAYSEPGQGATLRVYLPVISEEMEGKTKETVSIEQLKGNGERILVVEDEEGVREFATRVLGRNDYVVFEVANTREALDIFKREQGRFDLVFSDIVLPDKNGLELAKQLLSLNPQLPILMTSGYIDQKAHWPVIQERGFRFLQKPFSIINLLQAVKETME